MDRKLGLFGLLIGLFVISLFVGGETRSASIEKDNFSAYSDGNRLGIHCFYGKGCLHCAKVEPFLAEMEQKYPLQLHKFDVYSNRSCLLLFDKYSGMYDIPLGERGVPTVFVSDTYFVGDRQILNGFEEAVKKALKESSPVDETLLADRAESLDTTTIGVAGGLSIATVTVAALVDAISPCSIAILVFLIGARVLVANRRKKALKVGLAFCLSVFIAYFLFGLGLFTVVQVSGFSGIFSLLVGLVAVLAGIFYLKDVFWYGGGGFVMEVPRSLKPLLTKMLKGVTSPFGAFVMGFVVCLFELPCTGGPYLFILGQLADSATRLQAIPLLLYYNFLFVLPLIMISLLLYSNLFSIGKVREWNERNKRLLRLIGAFAMMALGFLVMPVSPMLHFIQLILRCFKVIGPPVLVVMFLHSFASFAKRKNLGSRFMRIPGRGILLLLLIVTTVFIVPNLANFSTGQSSVVSATEGAESEVEDDGNDGIPLLPHCWYLRERPDFDITNADECTIPRLTLTLHCYEYIATGGGLAGYALASQLLWNFLLQFGDKTVDSKYFEKDPAVENAKNTAYYGYTKPKIDEMMENMNCGESKSDVVYVEQSIEPSDPKLFYAVNVFDLYSKHEISITKNCDKCEEYGEVKIHSTWTVRDRYDWHPGEYAGGVYDDWAKFLHNCNWAKEFDVTSEWSEDKSEKIVTHLKICTDNDPCTMDLCDPDRGCMYRPIAGCDHPDDNFDVSTPKTDSNSMFNPETRPNIAILKVGNAYSTQELLASFNEHSVLVEIDFSPDLVKDYPVLIIPSGGLYGLDSLPSFKLNLEEYVKNSGSLIVLSQQHGYEFNALPSGQVSGFGWLEDQSCHHRSVGISTYHPMLSGQDSVTCDVNVDGYFTKYPENATILLSRTKNGMPAMLMYNYGKGTVIATTAYTDWAYMHFQATRDGINLMRDMISWAKNPREIPEYGTSDIVNISVNVTNLYLPAPLPPEYPQFELGDTVNLSINVTNYYNTASDKVVFEVIDPDFKIVYVNVSVSVLPNETKTIDFTYETTNSSKGGIYYVFYSLHTSETVIWGGVGEEFALGMDRLELTFEVGFTLRDSDRDILKQEDISVSVPTGETEVVNFAYENPSKLGIWNLEYGILDYNYTLIDFDTIRFAVSRYAENPEGFVYQGEKISFAVSSPEERYAYGSDVPFTIHIWNKEDRDRSILVKTSYYDWSLRSVPLEEVNETLHVPAHGEATYTHTVHVGDIYLSHNQLIIRAYFYEDGKSLGRTEKVVYMFSPSVDVHVDTDQKEYAKGEDVFVFLDFTNKRSASCNATIMVKTLDPDNNKVFENTFNVNLNAYESLNKTLSFSLPITSEYGIYLVTAEAYADGKKIGSGSTHFEVVKDYIIKVSFDKPDRAYRIRENMSIDLEMTNIGSALWNSVINISIPVLAFEDSKYVSLNLNQTEKINYNLDIPETTPARKHDIMVTIGFDNSMKKHYFLIPESNLVLSSDRASYNAGEDLSINLTNIGGVDATFNCSIKFSDSRGFMIYESDTTESVLAGESEVLGFKIEEQIVNGQYYLMAWCRNLKINKMTRLSKSYTIGGLKAVLASVTDKRAYFTAEDISISTDITNLNGEIANGTLNLRIFSRSGLPGSKLADSAGKEFFLVYTDNYDDGSGAAVFITSGVDTSGLVEIPGIGFSQPFTITANTITTVNIPLLAEVSGSDNIEDKGIRVLAEDDVTVYFLNPSTPVQTNDAYLGLPVDILGNEYMILGYAESLSARGASIEIGPSEIAIVAPYDDTMVTITPSVTIGATITAGVPYTITLQRFQTYTLQSDSPQEDLTGTIIESYYPIAVFAGVRCADIPPGYGWCDHLVEQMTPTATWGKEFDTFPFIPRHNGRGDFLRILASTDDTVVTVNGSVIGTIDRGEFLEITVTEPLEITATEPVLVAQYLTGQGYEGRTGDPFECLIPPTEQFLLKYTFVTPIGYAENYVNLIAPTSSLGDLLLDGSPVETSVFSPFGTRGLSAGTITLGEGSHTMLGSAPFGIYVYGYNQYVSYGYPGGLALKVLREYLIWEKNIPVDMSDFEIRSIVTTINIPSEMPDVTGKLDLLATLYTSSSQIINQSSRYSFFITDKNMSLTLETDKEVYRPNENIVISGEVKNNGEIENSYTLSIKKDEEEIFSDAFTLAPGESYSFITNTNSDRSFTLEGTVDGVIVMDFIRIEYPNIDVNLFAPDVVGLADFDVGVLIENLGDREVDSTVSIGAETETWDIVIPGKESRLIETTMSIIEDTTLNVVISGDVEQTIQKETIMGEDAKIEITPQPNYLEGIVEIPYTIQNIGLLDSQFVAIFSIDDQTISRNIFVPKDQNITDSVSFNLTKGAYSLKYISPFEEVNVTVNVGSPPEFIVTSILPANLNFTIGQSVIVTFVVENIGGTEGEATMKLRMPDFEDKNTTWIRPGEEENTSFSFTIPDDLEEKSYKGIYELNGEREEFAFFVQGAKISVDASLDKPLYEEGETAIFTLTIINERGFDLSLNARVQLGEYEQVKHFNLTDLESLIFNVPTSFNGQKLFYGIYMGSGRALYLNSMYIQKKEDIITLYTDKQVYSIGDKVRISVDATKTGTLNITAPGFTTSVLVTGTTTLQFTLPELRSGTYYIDYTFDGFSSSYPFDVIGYFARIVEFALDKEEYKPGDIVTMKMTVEVNRGFSGILSVWIYDPVRNVVDSFEIDKNFTKGENRIHTSRTLTSREVGIHALVCGVYANLTGHSLVVLASGARYFDVYAPHGVSISLSPTDLTIEPGQTAMYTINVTNTGGVQDTYSLTPIFTDFNGDFRAYPRAIEDFWTTLNPTSLTLDLEESANATLTITVPQDWAGMEEATYNFTTTATCQADPTVTANATATLTVEATKRTMAEYAKLELIWLNATVTDLDIKEDVKAGLIDKLTSTTKKVDQAIEWIKSGKGTQAYNMLKAAQNIIEAFISQTRAQRNKAIPAAIADDLITKAQKITEDIENTKNTPIN